VGWIYIRLTDSVQFGLVIFDNEFSIGKQVTKDHHGLETEEVGIISGALEMKTKTVSICIQSMQYIVLIRISCVTHNIFFSSFGYNETGEGHNGTPG